MRNTRTIVAMLVLAIAVAVAAWLAVSRDRGDTDAPALLFPDLAGRVNEVIRVELRGARQTAAVVRSDAGWTVAEKYGYPADEGAIRSLVLGMAEARIVERKTRNPELYHRLGLRDVTDGESSAVLVTLIGPDESTIASILVGEAKNDDRYVRLAGADRALLVTSIPSVTPSPADWLHRAVIDAGREEISRIEIVQTDGRVVVEADEDGQMRLVNLPEGGRLRYQFALEDFASVFAELRGADVRRADGLNFGNELSGKVVLKDGLEIRFQSAVAEDATWFRFVADAPAETGDAADRRAAAMNEIWDGWAYALADADLDRLSKPLSELIETEGDSRQGAQGDTGQGAADSAE